MNAHVSKRSKKGCGGGKDDESLQSVASKETGDNDASSFDGGSSAADGIGSSSVTEGSKRSFSSRGFSIRQHRPVLAAQETKALRRIRIIVFTFLFLSMVAIALCAYFFTRSQEQQEFEDQYYEDANKILSTMGSNIERSLQSIDAFVVSITSLAKATNQTWPFVQVPDFAVRAEKVRSLSTAVVVVMYNYVRPHQREKWENFTARAGPVWVEESVAIVADYDGMPWAVGDEYNTWDRIWDFDEFDKENPGTEGTDAEGPWLPQWHTHPCIPTPSDGPYNWYVKKGVTLFSRRLDARELSLIPSSFILRLST